MNTYKKIMDTIAKIEQAILVLATVLILVLTVGNVFSRKVIHMSWSFTEELVVALFVLITLMAAGLCMRKGELINLTLVTDKLSDKAKKIFFTVSAVLCIAFSFILVYYGIDKCLTQMANGKRTFVLNWPEWIFWSFVPIGAICMILHTIENYIDFARGEK